MLQGGGTSGSNPTPQYKSQIQGYLRQLNTLFKRAAPEIWSTLCALNYGHHAASFQKWQALRNNLCEIFINDCS